MEQTEVDEILLISLKDVGCPLEEGITTLSELSPAGVYTAAAYCMNAILGSDSNQTFPKALPRQIPIKVNICTRLVASIQKNGYRGELSYHNFLYPNVDVTRRVLMWLVQTMPSKELGEGGAGGQSVLRERVVDILSASREQLWLPSFCRSAEQRVTPRWANAPAQVSVPTSRRTTLRAEESAYAAAHQRALPAQCARPRLVASLLHHNAARCAHQADRDADWAANGIASGLPPPKYRRRKMDNVRNRMLRSLRAAYTDSSQQRDSMAQVLAGYGEAGLDTKFGHHGQFDHEGDIDIERVESESAEDVQARRAAEIDALEAHVAKLSAACADLEQSSSKYDAAAQQLRAALNERDLERAPLERQYKVLKKVMDLLPDAENNIARLKQTSGESGAALLELSKEWEARRLPHVERIRELVAQQARVEERYAARLDVIRAQRAQMKELVGEVRAADEKLGQLSEALRQLPNKAKRTLYTKRILELVHQVSKQQLAINDVLMDTRDLQKEIARTTEKLNRTYALASELIFADAKKNETAKTAFRQLADMNEKFQALSTAVSQTGKARNDILALEADSSTLALKTARLDVEQMSADLDEVQAANADAEARRQKAVML